MTVLPESMLRLMSPEDRATLGSGGVTASEAQERWCRREERRIHDDFTAWLNLHRHELYFDHSRMDRATTNRVGHPDFVIQAGGRVLNIEVKAPGGKLSQAQREVAKWIGDTRGEYIVAYSAKECIDTTSEWLKTP